MLVNVKCELEKEYVINNIVENTGYKLSKEEFETLCYLLSLKGEITIKDFATLYNYYNNHKGLNLIIAEKIRPLIDKGIILRGRETNSYLDKDTRNRVLELNPDFLDVDYSNLNYLDIKKFVKK